MPHLSGVPVRSQALVARSDSIRKAQNKIVIANRFGRIKNDRALAATARIRNTPRKQTKNRTVPRSFQIPLTNQRRTPKITRETTLRQLTRPRGLRKRG